MKNKLSYLTRKDSIILTSLEIIDELGFHELSIREIADRQGVSEPALYRHFKSKKDLVLAILDYFSQYDQMIANTIVDRNLNAKESIRFFVQSYAENYQNFPALTAVALSLDHLSYETTVADKIKTILGFREETLLKIILKGQERNELNPNIAGTELATMVTGILTSLILNWRLEKQKFALKEKVTSTLDSFLSIC